MSYTLAADEAYVHASDPRFPGSVRKLSSTTALVRGDLSKLDPRLDAAPVFYDQSALPPVAKLNAMSEQRRSKLLDGARRIMTAKLLVKAPADGNWSVVDATGPRARRASDLEGWFIVEYANAKTALAAADRLLASGTSPPFTPLFAKRLYKRQAATLQRPVTDPLYVNQWHLNDPRVSLRMGATWDTVTGKGINLAIVDDGLEVRHEDLAPNAYPVSSGYHVNFNDGPDEDPSPLEISESHGTQCAGIAGARGFNGIGVTGVAPEVRLIGIRLIAGDVDDETEGIAMAWQPDGIVTHVSSNSWGAQDDGSDPGRDGPLKRAAMQKMATTGRGGLGVVYSISAGNGAEEGDNSSYDEFSGSRFAIGVGAVNKKGEKSSYSEPGMNVAISALGGESAPPEMIWTTMNMGQAANDAMRKDQPTSTAPINYSDAMNGTSAAAPQVSGAAALLLERNPRLGYRDVKEILMRTARRDTLVGGDPFRTNGGGLAFSHSFGAGLLNVADAVDAAANWRNLGPLESVYGDFKEETDLIPEGSLDGVEVTFDFSSIEKRLRVEHVEVVVNVAHTNRGDVGFIITSPSGMVSIAEPRPKDEGENFVNYRFTSVRHWGEQSGGVWKVKVVDTDRNGERGYVRGIRMELFGTAAN